MGFGDERLAAGQGDSMAVAIPRSLAIDVGPKQDCLDRATNPKLGCRTLARLAGEGPLNATFEDYNMCHDQGKAA